MILKCLKGKVRIDYEWPDRQWPNWQIQMLTENTEHELDKDAKIVITEMTEDTVLELVNEM